MYACDSGTLKATCPAAASRDSKRLSHLPRARTLLATDRWAQSKTCRSCCGTEWKKRKKKKKKHAYSQSPEIIRQQWVSYYSGTHPNTHAVYQSQMMVSAGHLWGLWYPSVRMSVPFPLSIITLTHHTMNHLL